MSKVMYMRFTVLKAEPGPDLDKLMEFLGAGWEYYWSDDNDVAWFFILRGSHA